MIVGHRNVQSKDRYVLKEKGVASRDDNRTFYSTRDSIMGDNWEDWDSEEEIPVPAPILARPATKADKFADEDADVTDGPKWEGTVPEKKEVRV